jgi:osmotically-inducible protein OsmY
MAQCSAGGGVRAGRHCCGVSARSVVLARTSSTRSNRALADSWRSAAALGNRDVCDEAAVGLMPARRSHQGPATDTQERSTMLTTAHNAPLEEAVITSLGLDPRIPDSSEIAVAVEDGIVTLRGTVESLRQRRAAANDASKIDGVYEVDDQLKVSLLDMREDDEIRGAALQTLMWDAEVPAESVDVKVSEGWATLKGNVSHQFESDAAFEDVARMQGVLGITNEIKVTSF